MRIKEFEYCDRRQEWELEKIDFANLNLILFVGVSGAGKTRILQSILNLKKIAQGRSLNGVKWNIKFYTRNNELYSWMGEFEIISSERILEKNNSLRHENKYKIINEMLYKNETLIMERHEKHIYLLKGYDRIPPISPVKSVLEVFAQDEVIAPIKEEFDRIFDSNTFLFSNVRSRIFMNDRLILSADKISLEELREFNFPIQIKLALANKFVPEVFEEIKMHFIDDIFGCVEDMKIEDVDLEDTKTRRYDSQPRVYRQLSLFPEIPRSSLIFIKERGINHWISQENISSGMLKTLMHISELYLMPNDSVLLIDEFENSLGVNCLDIITKNLSIGSRNIQFILTSHHPYIINNIDIKSWKIVTRKGGIVKVKNAEDLGLGRSRHDAFMQLINSEEYTEGIETEEIEAI